MPVSLKTWRFIIDYILAPWMAAPLAAYGISRWRDHYEQPEWMPFFLKVQVFNVIQGVIFTGMAHQHLNNQWLRHITGPIIFAGLLWTMFRMAPDSRGRRIIYGTCLALGLVAAVVGSELDGMKLRNSIFTTTMSLVYLGLVPAELKTLTQSNDEAQLTSLPTFWVLAGLLVYSSGTLIFNASSNYFLRTLPSPLIAIPWVAVGIIYAIYQVMFAKAFLCPKPTSS